MYYKVRTENSEKVVGILGLNNRVMTLSEARGNEVVAGARRRDCETVDKAASLKGTVESIYVQHCAPTPVVAGTRIVGLLTLENIREMILVKVWADHPGTARSLPTGLRTRNP